MYFAYNLVLLPQTLMFQLLQKSKYQTEMLYFLPEYTLIINAHFTIGSKNKNSPLNQCKVIITKYNKNK